MRKTLTSLLAVLLIVVLAAARGPHPHRPSWKLAFSTHFRVPVPLGGFGGCGDWATTTCPKLPTAYKRHWWAYPWPWPDTATQRNYPVGGLYDPGRTVWVSGGELHIRMFRTGSGPVHSAALVPKAAVNRLYGKYVETWRVSEPAAGYKSAHLLWPHGDNQSFEVDYPEDEWDTSVCAFAHAAGPQQSFCPGTRWGGWHTTEIVWQPGRLTFWMDGKRAGHTTRGVPTVRMDWIIQNESALNGEQAHPGSAAQMDIRYVAYYSWQK